MAALGSVISLDALDTPPETTNVVPLRRRPIDAAIVDLRILIADCDQKLGVPTAEVHEAPTPLFDESTMRRRFFEEIALKARSGSIRLSDARAKWIASRAARQSP